MVCVNNKHLQPVYSQCIGGLISVTAVKANSVKAVYFKHRSDIVIIFVRKKKV